jgi:hypothetical protein
VGVSSPGSYVDTQETVPENSNEDCVLKGGNGESQAQAIPRNLILESVRCVAFVHLDSEELCKI